jgi:CYTH domain-containing protein
MSRNSFREIEKKYVLSGLRSQGAADKLLRRTLPHLIESEVAGLSLDKFYAHPTSSNAFIRTRILDNGTAELTVKAKDKGDNVDRLEVNCLAMKQREAVAFAEAALGKPLFELTKSYTVFFLPNNANVSTYIVSGDERLFLEIEAPTLKQVDDLAQTLSSVVGFVMEQEPRSLFEIFKRDGK